MSYLFEIKYIDINSLVDFSGLDNYDFGLVSTQENKKNENPQNPVNSNSDPLTEVFQTISEKVSVVEPAERKPAAVNSFSPPDQTNRYIGFIESKFDAAASAELIGILLNPYLLSLGYMFDFDELKSTFNYREMSGIKLPVGDLMPRQSNDKNDESFVQDLSETNLRRELEKKLQKELELKNELNKKLSYHQRF